MEEHRERLDDLAKNGQAPRALYIGCCDSRVVAEGILGAAPGDLFVVRTLANVVPPRESAETSVGAAIEFAVQVLQVRGLIVCGHTDCGGIKALETGVPEGDFGDLRQWIGHAEAARTALGEADFSTDDGHRALVEQNVLLQLEHARTYPVVADAEASGALTLHGWVFDLDTRRVTRYDAAQGRFVVEGD